MDQWIQHLKQQILLMWLSHEGPICKLGGFIGGSILLLFYNEDDEISST